MSYHVKAKDFIYGTMLKDGKLKAFAKSYYKQSRKSPYGWELVTEAVKESIDIEEVLQNENNGKK